MRSCLSRVELLSCVCAALIVGPSWGQQSSQSRQDAPRLSYGQGVSAEQPQDAGASQSKDMAPGRLSYDAMDVTERQSIDAFQSIEDGQPNPPGHFEFQFDVGWQTASGEHDPALLRPELKYTPDGCEFLRNMKLTLAVPMELGVGGVEGNADLEFGWQQRWVAEQGMMPTLATLAEIRAPSGYESSGVDFTLTGIAAKDLGPGTLYFNAFGKSANGDNIEDLRHFQWGARTGYRWRVSDDVALIGGYLHQSSEQVGHANSNLLELSGEWHVNDNITIGPGVFIGLDDNEETPNFGAGVRLTFSL